MTQFEPVSSGYLNNHQKLKKEQITGCAYAALIEFIKIAFFDKNFPPTRKYNKRKRKTLTA